MRRFATGARRGVTTLARAGAVTLVGFWAATAASAHTVQICWRDAGGVTTFYAGTYHNPSEAPSPVGDIIIDGFNYPFSGFILPAALPADVQCFSCPNNPPAVVHYQTFTSAFAAASHSISFDSSTVVQAPYCTFPDQTFGGGACADADFDGICNDQDACPLDAANDGDGDGLCADADNCPLVANPDQTDANGNGQGDACEGVVCGNNLVTPPEECDDGNLAGGDGCSAICTIETPPATCGNGTVEAGEQCDDGNAAGGDCCSATCQFEAEASPCGDGGSGECTSPDACDGAGTCLANHAPAGASCGDAGSACVLQDTCDGNGACVDNGFAAAGTACGDASASACSSPDTCDGAGACAPNHAPANTPCASDGNDCSMDLCDGAGACTHPLRPDGSACDDGNICTQADACLNGVCGGNNSGADTDGDGYCDLFENQQGCDPTDAAEIPPQAPTYGGWGASRGNVLVTYAAPTGSKIDTATDPSCATAGVCGPPPLGFVTGFCQTGRIADACNADADCDLPADTCRMVVNYADIPDLTLEYAFLNRRSHAIAGFSPVTPGCSRKIDLALDAVRSNRVRVKARGTVFGRKARDLETFRYR
jgi:cysteine-rich repeat protein